MKRFLLALLCGLMFAAVLPAAKTLDMWLVDTEGGKAVLLVNSSGQSMLIDTGFPPSSGGPGGPGGRGPGAGGPGGPGGRGPEAGGPGGPGGRGPEAGGPGGPGGRGPGAGGAAATPGQPPVERDANRILEAAKLAGIKKIDILVTTHYDLDHVNNVPVFAAKMPIDLFIDHGAVSQGQSDERTLAAVKAYDEVWAKAKHRSVKVGDTIPFGDVNVLVVTAAEQTLKTPVRGAGAPNPSCQGVERKTWPRTNEDTSENGNAIGLLFTYGQFKMLDLADLTWNHELELMCPNNPIGTVDMFMVSHHGTNLSNSPALVNPLHARVMMMDNGQRKTGSPDTMKILRSAPGLQALYLSHWSQNAPDDNPPDEFIANLQNTTDDGKWLKASVSEDGTIVVTNGRTGESKTYKK